MTKGEKLFDDLTVPSLDSSEEYRRYEQILLTAHVLIGDRLYPMLEQAEAEGKKIAVKDGQYRDQMYVVIV